MSRLKIAVLTIVLSIWAVGAAAQDLRSGLDAIKRGNWAAALQELGPLAESEVLRRNTRSGRCTRTATAWASIFRVPKDCCVRPHRAASGAHARISSSCGSRASSRRRCPGARWRRPQRPVSAADAWRVQLATVPTPDLAQREFRRLSRQFGELLAGTDLLAPPSRCPTARRSCACRRVRSARRARATSAPDCAISMPVAGSSGPKAETQAPVAATSLRRNMSGFIRAANENVRWIDALSSLRRRACGILLGSWNTNSISQLIDSRPIATKRSPILNPSFLLPKHRFPSLQVELSIETEI